MNEWMQIGTFAVVMLGAVGSFGVFVMKFHAAFISMQKAVESLTREMHNFRIDFRDEQRDMWEAINSIRAGRGDG